MGAFIVAGLILLATVVLSILKLLADAAGDERGDAGTDAGWWFLSGCLLAVMVLASHWLPAWGW